MDRNDVLAWLNSKCSRPPAEFIQQDLEFIRNYIHHYKNKLISFENIVHSIQHKDAHTVMKHIEFMINKLITDFGIKSITEKRVIQDPQYNIMTGQHPFSHQEVEMIVKYE